MPLGDANQPPDAPAGDSCLRPEVARHVEFGSHWLKTPAGRMHFVDEGPRDADETLLFVHGNPTWSYHWRRLIKDQRRQRRCVAMDHLGMGGSDLPESQLRLADHIDNVVRLIDELDLRDVTLVAQDWGGSIGLGALQERRERFDRIVLYNTGAFPPDRIPLRIDVCRTPLLGRLGLQGLNAFSRAALRMTLSRSRNLPPGVGAAYLAPHDTWARRRAVYDFVKDIPKDASHPTWSTLTSIEQGLPALAQMPICLIWGMQDWCFVPWCLDRFLKSWPQAEAHRLEDVGHWVVEDAPHEAGQILTRFLAAHPAARAETT
ncbi:Haloalkane dehalogenase [Posidoniimonas corsicana]|uniref:Haloalkane dehalogenase n=1 Tax=Posidoniimonas corsicana TaxID=1938618 RepID=A0A5C5VJ96_9BACT|nr:alpha/beta fold hydrolase [Posidoniimonas corsicana]TWT38063.1 Haloalkane dehalogenase [Posidoniimonas corsicana]